LAGNYLKRLPSELFSLSNITVLSVRNNSLELLPAVINQLSRIQSLNIAGNKLKHLPWELLEIMCHRGHHCKVIIRPNPLVQPWELGEWIASADPKMISGKDNYSGRLTRDDLDLRLKSVIRSLDLDHHISDGNCLIYLASSTIKYFTIDGSRVSAAHVTKAVHCSVPSLFELKLRTLQALDCTRSVLTSLEPYISPAMMSILDRTISFPAEFCSVCGHPFIVARAKGMEYWFRGQHGQVGQQELRPDAVLPFLCKACSWACAQPRKLGRVCLSQDLS
ncbi:hypothetical protein K470DRAFT_223488, partial [Piedraia hortae CBS 480.64]